MVQNYKEKSGGCEACVERSFPNNENIRVSLHHFIQFCVSHIMSEANLIVSMSPVEHLIKGRKFPPEPVQLFLSNLIITNVAHADDEGTEQ